MVIVSQELPKISINKRPALPPSEEGSPLTQYIPTVDGLKIAYDTQGVGHALLLLHGFSNDRQLWHRLAWPEALAEHFTVITMDLRGCGESSRPSDPSAYLLERHLEDIEAVLDACGVPTCHVWGWSFGATLALHLAARSARVNRVVACGSYFGRIFTEEYVAMRLAGLAPLGHAKATGNWESLSTGQREYAEATDLGALEARWRGLETWPGVEPIDLRRPTLVYTGTEDGNVVVRLREQRQEIEAAGLTLNILDGKKHYGLIADRAEAGPLVLDFLG